MSRLQSLVRSFKRKPQMEKDYVEFLGKVIEHGHAELVADTESDDNDKAGNVWYLPHFGVYHPKKPEQIQVVFDSSASTKACLLTKYCCQVQI